VARNLSQEGFGLLAGCEPSYIGRIERGRENTTVETLEMLADALDIQLSEFFIVPEAGAVKPPSLRPGRKPKAS
jgi:transcriptional regulator with XRE-family HTH domain